MKAQPVADGDILYLKLKTRHYQNFVYCRKTMCFFLRIFMLKYFCYWKGMHTLDCHFAPRTGVFMYDFII